MSKKSRREKNTEYQRTYRQKHPDRISGSNKAYYQAHKEAIQDRNRANREAGVGGRGPLIRIHRQALGLSQQEYAAALGITQALLSLWERDKSPANLTTVEAAFPDLAERLREE